MMTSDKQTDISSNVLKESFWVDICGAGNDGETPVKSALANLFILKVCSCMLLQTGSDSTRFR